MEKFYILFYNKPIKLKIDIYIIGYQFFFFISILKKFIFLLILYARDTNVQIVSLNNNKYLYKYK